MKEIKNSTLLIDTDVIIDHLRGLKDITAIIDESSGNTYFLSAITIAEVYSFLFPEEFQFMEELIAFFKVINVDTIIAKTAGRYRMIYFKSHNLTVPDALIAATAKITNAMLVTKNIRHFPMKDIDIIRPY